VWGDGAYHGQKEELRKTSPQAQARTCERTRSKDRVAEGAWRKNRMKSKVRVKVEPVFRILKRVFGFEKVWDRGLAKNPHRLCACFALGNLYLHRERLARLGAQGVWGRQNGLWPVKIEAANRSDRWFSPFIKSERSLCQPQNNSARKINPSCRGFLERVVTRFSLFFGESTLKWREENGNGLSSP
jgi:hypothetical protein